MTYTQAFIDIMTNSESPFKDISVFSIFNPGSMLGAVLNYLWMLIGRGLDAVLTKMEEFANYCYNFLSFSNNDTFRELYKVINTFATIPIAICLIIIAFKYVSGDINKSSSKTFIKNLGIFFFMLCVMPSIFNFMNNTIIGNDFLYTIEGRDSNNQTQAGLAFDNGLGGQNVVQVTDQGYVSTATKILRSNTTDYWYLYKECSSLNSAFGMNTEPDNAGDGSIDSTAIIEDLNELNGKFSDSPYSRLVSFNFIGFDVNQTINSDTNGFSGVPLFFRSRCFGKEEITTNVETGNAATVGMYSVMPLSDGVLGIGEESYFRYHVDFFNTFLQLIAVALMYFCVGYSVLKLIYELLIHQLFGPVMAAMDLTGGQRIKKYLSSIIGCYIGLIISSIVIMLYNYACNFLNNMGVRGLIKSLLMICLAIIFLDGPNIIARYFGVNTGIRGGMAMAGLAMLRAARIAGAPVRLATNVGTSALNNVVRDRMNAPRMRKQEASRQAERQADRRQRAAEQSERERQDFNRKQGEFNDRYGTDGNYEKYKGNIDYDKNNVGSEENKDAILQKAGMAAAYNDMQGKETNNTEAISSAASAVGIDKEAQRTNPDVNNALKSNPANIRDSKQGMYRGIAQNAESTGGTKEAYLSAAEKAMDQYGANPVSPETKAQYKDYLADASYNAQHASQIRTEAQNIKAASAQPITDVEAYTKAMDRVSGNYQFSSGNKERIATAELRDNGSLRNGSLYDKRPTYRDGSRRRSALD